MDKALQHWAAARGLALPADSAKPDDIWAHQCCELAWQAWSAGNYPVGALLVNAAGELVVAGHNRVFDGAFQSQRHAEMEVLDRLESDFPGQDRAGLTLWVSLEPCLMCTGRLLLSGVRRVRYLTADPVGGFVRQRRGLPPVWTALARHLDARPMVSSAGWQALSRQLVDESAADLRRRVASAWAGVESPRQTPR